MAQRTVSATIIRLLLLAVLLVPLIFIPPLYDIYDLAKATYVRIIAVVMISLWVLHAVTGRKVEVPRTPLLIPVALFLAVTLVSTFASTNWIVSTMGALKRHEGWPTYFIYGLLLLGAATFFRRRDLNKVSAVFAGTIIAISVYGIFQRYGFDFMDFGSTLAYDLTRAFGTTGNPVFLGTLLSLAVPYFGVLILQPGISRWRRMLYALAGGLGGVACLFTYSRGAWLGLAAALPLAVLLVGPRTLFRRWKGVLAMVVIAGLLLGATALLKPPSSQFSESITGRAKAALNVSEGSSGTRVEMWKSTLEVVAGRPLLGFGLEQFKAVFPAQRSLKLIELEGEFAMPDRPHNELLYVASSLGILGTAAFLWVFIVFFWWTIRWLRQVKRAGKDAPAVWGVTAIVVAVFADLVAETTSFTTVNTTSIAWLLMGFAGALIVPVSKMREIRLPVLKPLVRYPLYGLLIVWVALAVQFIARFPVADYYYNEGRFARAYGRFDDAQRYLEASVRLNPYQNLYRIELGAVYTDNRVRTGQVGWRQEAADVYEDAVAFDRYDEDSWANLGNSYLDLAQSDQSGYAEYLDRSENAFKQALRIDPYFSVARVQLGSIYLALGKYASAADQFRTALRVSKKDAEVWLLYGDSLAGGGKTEEALKAYKQVLKIDPKHKNAKAAVDKLSKAIRGQKNGGKG